MKKVWARIGMTVEVTDEQYEALRKEALNPDFPEEDKVYDDLDDFPKWLLDKFEKEGEMDGDCYIPGCCWSEW